MVARGARTEMYKAANGQQLPAVGAIKPWPSALPVAQNSLQPL